MGKNIQWKICMLMIKLPAPAARYMKARVFELKYQQNTSIL